MVSLLVMLDLAVAALLPVPCATHALRRRLAPWAVRLPFILAFTMLALDAARPLPRLLATPLLDVVAVTFAAAALGLLLASGAALRTEGRGDGDARIPSRGPYAFVRHPVGSALMLALGAGALVLPSPWMLVALAWGCVALDRTVAGAERAWLASPAADRYRAYAARTGRYVPPLRRL